MTLIHVITLRWKITLSNSKNDQYFFFTKNIFKMQKLSSFEFFFIHLHV